MKWPVRFKGGTTCDALISDINVVPTLLDAAGVKPPADMLIDGRSLLPMLTSGKKPDNWRNYLFLEITYTRAIVTDDGWKYLAVRIPEEVRKKAAGRKITQWGLFEHWHHTYNAEKDYPGYFDRNQLYNLRTDPAEQHNLAGRPEYAQRLKKMQQYMREYPARLKLPHAFGEFTNGAKTTGESGSDLE